VTADLSWLDFSTDPDDVHSLAETIELMMVYEREPFLALSELRSRFPAGNQPSDAQMTLAFGAIDDRRREMGALYPFVKEGRGVRFDAHGPWHLYALLLLLSFKGTPLRLDKDWPRSDALFDDIARRAVLAKMGSGTKSLLFGWPPRDGRPSTFPEALEWVANQLGVELRMPKERLPSHHRDAGVDVLAWSPFADGRTGFPIILVQDTVQFEYVKKPRDVAPARWRDWIELGTNPTVGFVIPFLVPRGHRWWEEIAAEVNLFLDRTRIMELLRSEDPKTWHNWDAIEGFVEIELSTAPSRAAGAARTVSPMEAPKRKKKA
jgi:hypothetical protein